MRAGVPDMLTPHPVVAMLPGIYQQPVGEGGLPFLERFCDGLDEVLSPVISTLDNMPAYLDVGTTPSDFLPWLAHWIGMPLGPSRSVEATRQVLQAACLHQGWQGTARGITLVVEAVFGCQTTVEDSGGVTWSREADAGQPPDRTTNAEVVVRVATSGSATVDPQRLDALVATLIPAHVPHRVVVTGG